MTFEPKIAGFLCDCCAYVAADRAGHFRMSYPPNIQIIRIMCSGRVDPAFVLYTLKKGFDGVLIAGCHLGECHYEKGNFKTRRRIALLKKLIEQMGIEPERVRLEWISAEEGDKFVNVVEEMVDEIKQIGPNPLGEGE